MRVDEVRVFYDKWRRPERVALVSAGEEIALEHVLEVNAPIVGHERRPTVMLTFRAPIKHVYHTDEATPPGDE